MGFYKAIRKQIVIVKLTSNFNTNLIGKCDLFAITFQLLD